MSLQVSSLGHVFRWCAVLIALNTSLTASDSVSAETATIKVPAPDFVLPVIANGKGALAMDDLEGSVVYLDFWASWCGPCRLSLPALDTIYQELKDQGLIVAAITVDAVEEDALDFLQRYPVSYPIAFDSSGDVPSAFAVNGMPSGYLIDRSGNVRALHVGFKRGDEVALRDEIIAMLEE
ncbi:MAG: thioredoxin [Halieaceae bacterium MED-G27]|nr:thioredoxin [Halieaceae bacterium]OUT67728.1 MAG: thioredoxin [Cellvibrionales bacterium TMED21]PDH32374.1 MAG: thioredoxin [Halieaceae bacterium MED-G27]